MTINVAQDRLLDMNCDSGYITVHKFIELTKILTHIKMAKAKIDMALCDSLSSMVNSFSMFLSLEQPKGAEYN
jgi:hypothetical protein